MGRYEWRKLFNPNHSNLSTKHDKKVDLMKLAYFKISYLQVAKKA